MLINTIRLIPVVIGVCTFFTVSIADNVAPSQKPPGNIPVKNVPQFLVLGFDDQETVAGMQTVIDIFKARKNPNGIGQKETFDGTGLRCSFYTTGKYLSSATLKSLHKQALADGFEIGNHSNAHTTGFNTTESTWRSEMQQCNSLLVSSGIPEKEITGFRTPFLEYNNATFKAMVAEGFLYDCSIEEGFEPDQAAGSYFWPHTLNNGSPGNKAMIALNQPYELITSYPGLWEIPCYNLIMPHDSVCEAYGITKGLRTRIYNNIDYFDPVTGKLTGLDYNVIEEAKVTAKEFTSTLKYNLDMYYKGNRAPMIFGAHSNYYSTSTWAQVLKDFLDYALKYPDVRIITAIDLINWMRNPKPLDPNMTPVSNMTHHTLFFQTKSMPHRMIRINGLHAGTFKVAVFTLDGKKLLSATKIISPGESNATLLSPASASAGVVIVSGVNNLVTFSGKVQLLD